MLEKKLKMTEDKAKRLENDLLKVRQKSTLTFTLLEDEVKRLENRLLKVNSRSQSK